MPKVVDADQRRAEIVAAAGAVIAQSGYAAATVRKIAAEAGYSSGVLDHYFADKDDLLLQALEASHRTIVRRLGGLTEGLRGLAAIRAILADNLPVDAQRRDETRLEMEFWVRCLGDPKLGEVQRREMGGFRGHLVRHLHEALDDGDAVAGLDPEVVAETLLAFMDGISLRAVIDPAHLPVERQLDLLDEQIERLRA